MVVAALGLVVDFGALASSTGGMAWDSRALGICWYDMLDYEIE